MERARSATTPSYDNSSHVLGTSKRRWPNRGHNREPNFSISCVTMVIHGVTLWPAPQGKESMFHIGKKPVVAQWAGWERAGVHQTMLRHIFIAWVDVDHHQVAATTVTLQHDAGLRNTTLTAVGECR